LSQDNLKFYYHHKIVLRSFVELDPSFIYFAVTPTEKNTQFDLAWRYPCTDCCQK